MKRIRAALLTACERMPAHTQELCELDTGIGDGDHGLTAERGFLAAAQAITENRDADDATVFSAIGEAMAKKMGGAIGPLYGAYWHAFSKALDHGTLTADKLAPALEAGCAKVMKFGKASPGDKTVVDAMMPCVLAASTTKGPLHERLSEAAEAAMEGALNTKTMIAKKGRARYLMEKSLGHIDAGAYSFALFMEHWAQAANTQGEESHEETSK